MSILSRHTVVGLGVSVGLAMSACSAAGTGSDTVSAKVELIDHVSSAVTSRTTRISAINGVYSDLCRTHYDGEPWSLPVNGSPITPYSLLSVVTNNRDCQLTLTGVELDGSTTYAGTPNLTLALAYAGTPSTFAANGQQSFQANSNINALGFAADFTIRLVVSEEPRNGFIDTSAAFTTQSSTVVATGVSAPDYPLDLLGFGIQTDVNNLVTNVGGYAQLGPNTVEGQTYAITRDYVDSTMSPADLETVWNGALTTGDVASLEVGRIPAEQFQLLGDTLLQVRFVMIRNTQNSVTSYQLIEVVFFEAH